jgi:4-hydroxybenzoate polyprenyltransferase
MRNKLLIFISLCLGECVIGVGEIGLATAYLLGINHMGNNTPIWQVCIMVLIYIFIVVLLFHQTVKAIKSYRNDKKLSNKNIFLVMGIGVILAVYMIFQISSGVAAKLNDEYFLISLSWNIPRLLLDTALIVFCVLLLKSNRINCG